MAEQTAQNAPDALPALNRINCPQWAGSGMHALPISGGQCTSG
jgi:hypothetical protein